MTTDTITKEFLTDLKASTLVIIVAIKIQVDNFFTTAEVNDLIRFWQDILWKDAVYNNKNCCHDGK